MVLKARVVVTHEAIDERLCQARLANAGLPHDVDDAPFTCLGLGPAPQQQIELLLAAEQRSNAFLMAGLKAARSAARPEHPPHVDRPAKALEGLGAEISAVEPAGNEAKGLRRNEDRVGLRERLQAGGEVGGLADCCLLLGSPREIADHGEAGGDADADLQG